MISHLADSMRDKMVSLAYLGWNFVRQADRYCSCKWPTPVAVRSNVLESGSELKAYGRASWVRWYLSYVHWAFIWLSLCRNGGHDTVPLRIF